MQNLITSLKDLSVTAIFLWLLAVQPCPAFDVQVQIDAQTTQTPISPWVYGSNMEIDGANIALRRLGGNRLTGYNWENNYSNAGSDWYHSSDQYLPYILDIPSGERLIPGNVFTTFHDNALAIGADSLLTLQMAGYVAADGDGTVDSTETAPSARWKQVIAAKGTTFTLSPDTTDDMVYMDELVNFLVDTYGASGANDSVRAYELDNEPALWSSTHARIHPDQPEAGELADLSIELAQAVKNVDPGAGIFGPVLYGYAAFLDFQGAPDWDVAGDGYDWFIDYYLDRMQQASDAAGKRLLDVLDIHWYSEAIGDGVRITSGEGPFTDANIIARMQAPRSLWDASYQEDSWIGQWFHPIRLIPALQDSIDQYYPGTKIAITEFCYGAENHISGGVAVADALGIFGKYGVHAACFWKLHDFSENPDEQYIAAAYKIYRNYDGADGMFAALSLPATSDDTVQASVYAALDHDSKRLHIIAINKSLTESMTLNCAINSARNYISGAAWAFDDASAQITQRDSIASISGNTLAYPIPPLTVCHLILTPAATPPPASAKIAYWMLIN